MSTLTPNYGLIVPEATDTVAQVRADYATNLGLIDNISGGGGSGGGNVFGTFIDTNNIIQASTMYRADLTYVATEDCVVFCEIVAASNNSAYIAIDGESVEYLYSEGGKQSRKPSVFLRKGQTLTAHSSVSDWNAYYTVYGLIQGTESIFTPIIYSDNERMIGIWRDNKPLYQKTISVSPLPNNGTKEIQLDSDIEKFISMSGYAIDSNDKWDIFLNDVVPSNNNASVRVYANTTTKKLFISTAVDLSLYTEAYITLQYTKTTDSAGSGDWNTDGIPMVHYSTTEQVIGTWVNGKTLYQVSYPFTVNISGGQTATIATISAYEDIVYLNGWINESNVFYAITDPSLRVKVSSSGQLQLYCSTGSSWNGSGYITVKYTKSS